MISLQYSTLGSDSWHPHQSAEWRGQVPVIVYPGTAVSTFTKMHLYCNARHSTMACVVLCLGKQRRWLLERLTNFSSKIAIQMCSHSSLTKAGSQLLTFGVNARSRLLEEAAELQRLTGREGVHLRPSTSVLASIVCKRESTKYVNSTATWLLLLKGIFPCREKLRSCRYIYVYIFTSVSELT